MKCSFKEMLSHSQYIQSYYTKRNQNCVKKNIERDVMMKDSNYKIVV